MKSFIKSISYSIVFMLLMLVTYSCAEDTAIRTLDAESPQPVALITDQAFPEVEELFVALNEQPALAKKSIAEQLAHLERIKPMGSSFSHQSTITSYEDAINLKGNLNEEATAVLEKAFLVFSEREQFSDATTQLRLISSEARSLEASISVEDYNQLQFQLEYLEYLTNSPAFEKYAELKTGNSADKGFLKCAAAQLYLSGLLVACASGQVYACAGIPYAIIVVADACDPGGGDPVDPCENSPNPCCGEPTCAPGYVQNVNCDCVDDPDTITCRERPCPPGYSCNGFECIPQ